MSKYSRTRKVYNRISRLDYWIINRDTFKRLKTKTWKNYKKHRKTKILFFGYNPSNVIAYNAKKVKLPCKI